MEKQSDAQVIQQWQAFLGSSEGSNIVDDSYNGEILAQYINQRNQGIVSYSFLCQAVKDPSILNRLHLKTGRWTAEQIAAKAAEEKAANEAARVNQVAADWVKKCCPRGLLLGSDLYEENSNRIVAYITKHSSKVSSESLSNAVLELIESNSLVWLSEDRELRNQPAPPSRESRLSTQAKIDAGLIQDTSNNRTHTKDSRLVNPGDKLRPVIKKLLGGIDPDKQAAESIGVQGRNGRPDYGFNTKLKQTFANNPDGSVNWKATRKLRDDLANGYERQKNR